MPDLQQLLLEESTRLRPSDAPPFGELVRRRRSRSRRRGAAAVGACGMALAAAVLLVPQVDGASSTERLARPTGGPVAPVERTPSAKQAPPGAAAAFTVLTGDGEQLPGNEWELVADPSVAVSVEVSRTGAPEMCLLFFEVVPAGGGAAVGNLTTSPPDGGGTGLERFPLTWTAQDPESRPLPAGRYRLVAQTQEQDRPCGVPGDSGPRRDVETSLGVFVVPPR